MPSCSARGVRLAVARTGIAGAIMPLHEEADPRHTTVRAIAERAGVERIDAAFHPAPRGRCSQNGTGVSAGMTGRIDVRGP